MAYFLSFVVVGEICKPPATSRNALHLAILRMAPIPPKDIRKILYLLAGGFYFVGLFSRRTLLWGYRMEINAPLNGHGEWRISPPW